MTIVCPHSFVAELLPHGDSITLWPYGEALAPMPPWFHGGAPTLWR